MKVAIVDYGSGNLQSVMQSLCTASHAAGLGYDIALADAADDVASADYIVLPGVGAFADCAKNLASIDGMIAALGDSIVNKGRPFLGICVGMQLMADRGNEDGITDGLGWIAGEVSLMQHSPQGEQDLKIPHMGWNTIYHHVQHWGQHRGQHRGQNPVFSGINNGGAFYFLHSYHFICAAEDTVLASTDYGGSMTAAVGRTNMVGVQFHPEKSQNIGQQFLTNWLTWKP